MNSKQTYFISGCLFSGVFSIVFAAVVDTPTGADPNYTKSGLKITDGVVEGKLVERVLPDQIRNALGLTDREMLLKVSDDKTTLYTPPGFKSKQSSEPIAGGTITHEFSIIVTHNSPSCFLYRDIWGNQRYYPVPDCPHR